MQFFGIMGLVAGYGSIYTAVQMLKRPAGGTSGNVLYWITGIDSLGAPGGGSTSTASAGGRSKPQAPGNGTQPKNKTLPTGRGTHSQ